MAGSHRVVRQLSAFSSGVASTGALVVIAGVAPFAPFVSASSRGESTGGRVEHEALDESYCSISLKE
ncbi:hypothetical protein, partial [Streptomyces sp. IBSBF 2950]|uniref:hypothetical protein n=1 Tax=Streptomyces sp. IBSBF 2950 TaxID=2903528 RepID=UPI002FDBF9CA